MATYSEKMVRLVEATGGETSEGRFIERPGVMVLDAGNEVTESARELFARLNINPNQPINDQLAEFAARLTYWSFPDEPESEDQAQKFHANLRGAGHVSPYRLTEFPSVLIAGDLETVLEIVAHKGRVGRTSSSRTSSMDNPLFRVWGTPEQRQLQKDIILRSLDTRRDMMESLARESGYEVAGGLDILNQRMRILKAKLGVPKGPLSNDDRERLYDAIEQLNALHPASKAGFMVNSMPIDDWRWVIEKRLNEKGMVEGALVEVLMEVARQLHALRPDFVKEPEDYIHK